MTTRRSGWVLAMALGVLASAGVASAEVPCADDVKKLCADVPVGGGKIQACLKAHDAQLSAGCKQQLEDRRARRGLPLRHRPLLLGHDAGRRPHRRLSAEASRRALPRVQGPHEEGPGALIVRSARSVPRLRIRSAFHRVHLPLRAALRC